ncbi:MAG TPA: winged helix-turn-helix domain-containing protein, partial [Oligoflexia bacterium]|nr:winged helix-turn-helix domain-containing protein [Oligoflexia bacterium]
LKARVKAILNWNKPAAGIPPVIDCEHLQIDIQRRTVSCAGEPRKLSATEFDILLFLALHPNQAFSREQICSAVLGYDAASTYGSLTVLLNRIRAKIEPDPASPRFIRTVRGVGYCFASTTQDQDEE